MSTQTGGMVCGKVITPYIKQGHACHAWSQSGRIGGPQVAPEALSLFQPTQRFQLPSQAYVRRNLCMVAATSSKCKGTAIWDIWEPNAIDLYVIAIKTKNHSSSSSTTLLIEPRKVLLKAQLSAPPCLRVENPKLHFQPKAALQLAN